MAVSRSLGSRNASWPQSASISQKLTSNPFFFNAPPLQLIGFPLRIVAVEGDGVDTWFELDEYVPDLPRFYAVTVSGWMAE